jgi:hypothetical protein
MLMTLEEAPSTGSRCHQRDVAAGELREAGDLPVGGRLVAHLLPYAPRKPARLDEAAGVDEVIDTLAGVQHALLLARRELLRAAHGERFGGVVFQLLDQIVSDKRSFQTWDQEVEEGRQTRCARELEVLGSGTFRRYL